jgi:hypothetical protein
MKVARRKRTNHAGIDAPDSFRRQHGGITRRKRAAGEPGGAAYANEAESPLAWLARRKGPDGRPFISQLQLAAGERLRADFTRAGLTPRVTANWIASIAQGRRSGSGEGAAAFLVIAAKERMARTLDAVGPEFAGLLLDVCCFLKGLETEASLQAGASAACASRRMRSTIERKPFERCGVRCSPRPSRLKSSIASVSRIFFAGWPE